MANIIEFKLCEDDRKRLDAIIEGLETLKTKTPTAAPATEAVGEPYQEANPYPEAEPNKEDTPKEETEPSVTLEQIQQKVVKLCACANGSKKAQVKEIINTYGRKVSDLQDQPDKWPEVWDKLTALE